MSDLGNASPSSFVLERGEARWRLVIGLLCLLIPMALVTVYTLNHFYRIGGVFWDAGLYNYFTTFSDQWPMLYPEFVHRASGSPRVTYFVIHFMPIFYLTTAAHHLVPVVPAAAYFSFLQGLWSGLIGLSIFMLCQGGQRLVLTFTAAIATALSGPVLATVGFPHPEIAVPALLLLFFALRSVQRPVASYVALALCLSVREDAGLHAAGPLFLLAGAQWMSDARTAARGNALIAMICAAYSFAALALQYFGFPSEVSQLERIYLGSPLGAHLSWALVADRATEFLFGRAYAVWPVIILFVVALWKRSSVLLAGAMAAVPWLTLSLLAVSDYGLWTYYSFPLIVAIAWPSVVHGAAGVRLQLILSVASIALFAGLGGKNLDKAPWRSLQIPNLGAIGTYEDVLRDTIGRRGEFGRIMVDDAVVSLIPEAVALDEWVLQWDADHLPNPDVVIYRPGGRFQKETDKAISASGLMSRCALRGTPFVVASRAQLPSLGASCTVLGP